MRHYSKREVNVTYTQVSDNVEVRTYPCLKFGSAYGTPLTPDQKETLRFRRIHLVIFKDSTKMSGMKHRINLITKKGQWGADVVENILKDVMKKSGEFNLEDKPRYNAMINEVANQIVTHNKEMMGLIKPKMMRDPKTGRFMKMSA